MARKYAKQILGDGITIEARGAPIAVQGDTAGAYKLLAGASLAEAMYVAHASPGGEDNTHVIDVAKLGYEQCIVLNSQIPFDVAKFIRFNPNSYHAGGGTSFLEIDEQVQTSVTSETQSRITTAHNNTTGTRITRNTSTRVTQETLERSGDL